MRLHRSLIVPILFALAMTSFHPSATAAERPKASPSWQKNATSSSTPSKPTRKKRRTNPRPTPPQALENPTPPTPVAPASSQTGPEIATTGYSDKPASGFGQLGYTSIPVDGPYVALTFDDGPHATNTPRLLKILASKGVKATFFVVGQCVQEYPEIARQIAAEGHELANHSWSHPNFAKLSDKGVKDQIDKTNRAIMETAGATTVLLRPPYGSVTTRQRHWLRDELGMKLIFWSVDPLDWKRPGPSVVTRRIVSSAAPGGIILAHDIHAGTIDAMDETIDQLKARGMKFVTVSELLAMEKKAPTQFASATAPQSDSPPSTPPTITPDLPPATTQPAP